MSWTHDTAFYQLRNLYFSLTREEILGIIKTTPLSEDRILYMSNYNCKILKFVMNDAKNSEHQRKITDFVEWI